MDYFYIKVPNGVIKMRNLSPTDKLMYGLLFTLGHKNDYIYAKNDFIGVTLGLTQYQVKKSLNVLKNEKLIEIINPNRYRRITILPFEPVKKVYDKEADKKLNDLLDKIYDLL